MALDFSGTTTRRKINTGHIEVTRTGLIHWSGIQDVDAAAPPSRRKAAAEKALGILGEHTWTTKQWAEAVGIPTKRMFDYIRTLLNQDMVENCGKVREGKAQAGGSPMSLWRRK